MSAPIVGTLPIEHFVDANGSFAAEIEIKTPPSKFAPTVSFAYHSAASSTSLLGIGWTLKGISSIERVPATIAQDGFRGSINYDDKDRFSCNGQRLIKISENEYRYEIEQWSKFVTTGSNPANPESWTEHLPNGSVRHFGTTEDSNIRADGQPTLTRVWAVADYADAFSNYITYNYGQTAPIDIGSFYLQKISYGGNRSLSMQHQRFLDFQYEIRPDANTSYLGGYPVHTSKRLHSVSASITVGGSPSLVHTYTLQYQVAPLTNVTRLDKVTLTDASARAVVPLEFDWSDGVTSVLDPLKLVTEIRARSDYQLIPIDTTANGRSDMVIPSKYFGNGANRLHLDILVSDSHGNLELSSSTDTDLLFPSQLLAIDTNGDGKVDLVHISMVNNQYFRMTVLLCAEKGYEPQTPTEFHPPNSNVGGYLLSGDFEGDGRVGLVYAYEVFVNNTHQLRFIQLVSDDNGTQIKEKTGDPILGPTDRRLDTVQLTVGDFNGNGADDVFLIIPGAFGDRSCQIKLLSYSPNGLEYHDEDILQDEGNRVPWESTIFFSHSVDDDGKSGLLGLSEVTNGRLAYQVLRSTGKRLLCKSERIPTEIAYNGTASLARTTSRHTLDLVNMFLPQGASEPHMGVLRFNDDEFVPVVERLELPPGTKSSDLSLADPRGLGITDCYLSKVITSGSNTMLRLQALPCSSTQPADMLTGYTNGLGAKVTVAYAPLTDGNIYTVGGDGSEAAWAANGMSCNMTTTAPLQAGASSHSNGRGRSSLVQFPKYVVQSLSSCALPQSFPDVLHVEDYKYESARLEYEGRGWLGFAKVHRSYVPLGTTVTTQYIQEFPFIGQASETHTIDSDRRPIQDNTYTWKDNHSGDKSWYITLPSQRKTLYESGVEMFSSEMSQDYDQFGNVTRITTTIPNLDLPFSLTVSKTYDIDTTNWILGCLKTEDVQAEDGSLRKTKYEYIPGTETVKKTSKWIKGSEWLDQSLEFNKVGNETAVYGPGPAERTITYDEMHTFPSTVSNLTRSGGPLLTQHFTFDPAHGEPSSVTDANGHTTAHVYDVLGRETQVSEVLGPNTYVMETTDFSLEAGVVSTSQKSRISWETDEWETIVARLDGFGHAWREETSVAGDATKLVYMDTEYDGEGRPVRKSRNYLKGTTPVFTVTEYDSQSRPLSITMPSANTGGHPTSTTFRYEFRDGRTVVTRTRSDESGTTPNETIYRRIGYAPHPEPSVDQPIKSLNVYCVDELNQGITTFFDGLCRPISTVDPQGVAVIVTWDGLSRQIQRKIACLKNDKQEPRTISDFTTKYLDSSHEVVITNQLSATSAAITIQQDCMDRPISKRTPDEQLTFTYDEGPGFSKSRLVSVTSSKGILHEYEHDMRGSMTKATLSMDDKVFTTSYEWSPSKRLLRTTNPDLSTITSTICTGSDTVKEIRLADSQGVDRASINFDEFMNPYNHPLKCTLGNGVVSTSQLAASGIPVEQLLQHTGSAIHKQSWDLNDYGKITAYRRRYDNDKKGYDKNYAYDAAGQLTRAQKYDANASDRMTAMSDLEFSYDDSGNISEKDGLEFITDAWHLTHTQKGGVIDTKFDYSPDGHLISKVDGPTRGIKRSLAYNDDGRLAEMDSAQFVYDYSGRLIKHTAKDGSMTWYPNEFYEVTMDSSGKTKQFSYINHNGRCASFNTELSNTGIVEATESFYYHLDHLQSVVAVSNNSGALVTQYDYDPYGKVEVHGPDISRYKFSGKEKFEEFYYFGARFYDSETGRFSTLDDYPIDLTNLTPSLLNQYSFAKNDPINFFDINGNVPFWHWIVDIALIVVGVIVEVASVGTLSMVSGALIGAGISGLMYDIQSTISGEEGSFGDYFKELATGAIFGMIGAGVGKYAAKAFTWAGNKVAPTLSKLAAKIFGPEPGIGAKILAAIKTNPGRITLGFAKDLALGPVKGVAGQMASNIMAGESIGNGLGEAAMWGAVNGAIGGGTKAFSRTLKTFRPARKGKFYFESASSNSSASRPPQVVLTRYRPLSEAFWDQTTDSLEIRF